MRNYPIGSAEYLIQQKLVPLIKEVKEVMFREEFKRSEEYNSSATSLKVLGAIVSKYCEWDAEEIETVARHAFADSNFDNVEINY